MIKINGITKKYGHIVAVNNISFTVETGQIYGFLGPNGAGKTTTMNIITGCLAATSGTVEINGYDIYEESFEAKKHLGYLPEVPPLYLDMKTGEYLRFVAEAKGIKKSELNEQVDSVLESVRIVDVKNRLIRNLSKGYRQRIGLAQAIIGNPEIIVLDEPTVGLDPRQIIEMRELIKELGKKHTVILSSHILSEVSAICDHIVIISKGNLVASDSSENLQKRFNSSNTLSLTVKGSIPKIKTALKKVDELTRVSMEKVSGEDMVQVTIESPSEIDSRDKVSKALINSDCLILSMTQSMMSLEDVFLLLTGNDDSAEDDISTAVTEDGQKEEDS